MRVRNSVSGCRHCSLCRDLAGLLRSQRRQAALQEPSKPAAQHEPVATQTVQGCPTPHPPDRQAPCSSGLGPSRAQALSLILQSTARDAVGGGAAFLSNCMSRLSTLGMILASLLQTAFPISQRPRMPVASS